MSEVETQTENVNPGIKGPVTHVLFEPIPWGKGETITEVTIKPLKGKHVKLLKKDSGMPEFIQIASKASGVPLAAFDEMSSADVLAIVEIVGNSL